MDASGLITQTGTHKDPIYSIELCEHQGQRVVSDLAQSTPPVDAQYVCLEDDGMIDLP